MADEEIKNGPETSVAATAWERVDDSIALESKQEEENEFVNHGTRCWIYILAFLHSCICVLNSLLPSSFLGLMRWEEARAEWQASAKNGSHKNASKKVAIPLDVDEIIDIIFSPRWRMPGQQHGPPRRFPKNVPLTQMVDVLVDLWEAEGLDM